VLASIPDSSALSSSLSRFELRSSNLVSKISYSLAAFPLRVRVYSSVPFKPGDVNRSLGWEVSSSIVDRGLRVCRFWRCLGVLNDVAMVR
jgi:hypothetical protein